MGTLMRISPLTIPAPGHGTTTSNKWVPLICARNCDLTVESRIN